jgi:hypothetical protein
MSCTMHQFGRRSARRASERQASVSKVVEVKIWAPDKQSRFGPARSRDAAVSGLPVNLARFAGD